MAETNIRLWARRAWWVDWFLWAMLPIAWVIKLTGGDVGRFVEWLGIMIGRYGIKTGIGNGPS